MELGRKLLVAILIIISITAQLFSLDRYDYVYPLDMFQSFYGIEHQNDAFSSMKNPALAAMLEHEDRGAFTISYNDWFVYSPLSIGALIPLSEDMELGFSFNYIDVPVMYGCIIGYGEERYYNLSTALAYHDIIDISLGFSAKLFRDKYYYLPELGYDETFYDFDAGALIQLPLMAALDKEEIKIFRRDMKFEVTPGVQAVWTNVKQGPYPQMSAFIKTSFYDHKLKRDLLDLIFSFGEQKGIKFGMMDLVNLYVENISSFNDSRVYELEVNCSQFARDIFDLLSKKQRKRGLLSKGNILISYGAWYLGYPMRRNNVNLSFKYDF